MDEGKVVVLLDHPITLRRVILAVSEAASNYGMSECSGDVAALINCAALSDAIGLQSPTIDHIRSLLLSQHVASLLGANGYVLYVQHMVTSKYI